MNNEINIEAPVQAETSPAGEAKKIKPDLKHGGTVLLAALAIGTLLQIFIYENKYGAQWAIAAILLVLGAVLLARQSGYKLPWQSWILAAAASGLSLLTVFRVEGYTSFTLAAVSFAALIVLASTFVTGQWASFRLREHITAFLHLLFSVLIGPFALLKRPAGQSAQPKTKRGIPPVVKSVLIGLLISLPLLFIFGTLLMSADSVFGKQMSDLFRDIFSLQSEDLIYRLILTFVLTYLVFRAFAHALTAGVQRKEMEPDQPAIKPFLGLTESAIVFGSLNLLFGAFLLVQFRYFFAGESNIGISGLSYAEYARRGFFELVVVACLVLLLYFVLDAFTKRETSPQRRTFSVLGALLIAQVGVVLVSAYKRLELYELAYGFTQTRVAAHVVIIFIGVLLLAFLLMELTRRFKHTALVLFLAAILFAVTLTALNVDNFVTERNIARGLASTPNPEAAYSSRSYGASGVDASYLIFDVSADGVPAMVRALRSEALDAEMRQKLEAVFTCRSVRYQEQNSADSPWFSLNVSKVREGRLYQENADLIDLDLLVEEEAPFSRFKSEGVMIDDNYYVCRFPDDGWD